MFHAQLIEMFDANCQQEKNYSKMFKNVIKLNGYEVEARRSLGSSQTMSNEGETR